MSIAITQIEYSYTRFEWLHIEPLNHLMSAVSDAEARALGRAPRAA